MYCEVSLAHNARTHLEVQLVLGVPQLRDVAGVDRLGTTAARNEDIGRVAQVSAIAEARAVGDQLAARQLDVRVLAEHAVALGGELGDVELADRLAGLGEADELLAVDADGVVEHAAAVDDPAWSGQSIREHARDRLVLAEQDLIRAEVAVGPAGLDLGDLLLLEAELAVDAEDVLPDRQTGHAERIVRHAAELLSALAGREAARSAWAHKVGDARLPEDGAALASVHGGPVHHVGRALVRAEEEDLLVLVQVDDRLLDAGRGALEEQVEDGVDVLAKDDDGLGAEAARSAARRSRRRTRARSCPSSRPLGCPARVRWSSR